MWEEQWQMGGGWERAWSKGGCQWDGLAVAACLLLKNVYGVLVLHFQLWRTMGQTLQLVDKKKTKKI